MWVPYICTNRHAADDMHNLGAWETENRERAGSVHSWCTYSIYSVCETAFCIHGFISTIYHGTVCIFWIAINISEQQHRDKARGSTISVLTECKEWKKDWMKVIASLVSEQIRFLLHSLLHHYKWALWWRGGGGIDHIEEWSAPGSLVTPPPAPSLSSSSIFRPCFRKYLYLWT